jgi:uncharacterized coiled-coil DUF342 family protein
MTKLTRTSLVVAIVSLLGGCVGCGSTPEFESYAKALRKALDGLQKQRDTAVSAYNQAECARKEALSQDDFKFTSKQTRSFVDKWAAAESEVRSLRSKYDELLKTADLLFTYCYEKCATISNEKMRSTMRGAIERQQKRFGSKALAAHREIASVARAIGRGKDLIKALEIVGALGALQGMADDLDGLAGSAARLQPSIDDLKSEGESLLRLELSALMKGGEEKLER